MMEFFNTLPLSDIFRGAVEIILLFFAIYGILYYLRGTRASLVLAGIVIVFVLLRAIVSAMGLMVIDHLLNTLAGSLILILLIIFQPELRRVLAQLGSFTVFQWKKRQEVVDEVVAAVKNMAKRKCGALIVLERRIQLQGLVDDSIMLDSQLSSVLLENIFFPNSPLHDGAVIIRDNRIVATRAILPLTRAENVSKRLGTRHRAALGLSEECDAVTIVVSEETGSISVACRGKLYRDLSLNTLTGILQLLMVQRDDSELEETMKMLEAEKAEQVEI